MFAFLKIAQLFVLPIAVGWMALVAVAYLWRRGYTRVAWWTLVVLIAAFYILAIDPTAHVIARSLEQRVRGAPSLEVLCAQDVIVILAGGATEVDAVRPIPELTGASWRRLARGVELYRACAGRLPVIYSGGSGDPFIRVSHEAIRAREIASMMGVPESAFSIETTSRDTYENAVETRRMLDARSSGVTAHHIVLVTSAWHMPRALGAMRRVGLDPVPAPADYMVGEFRWNLMGIIPNSASFETSMDGLREWIGIAVYRLRGRI